MALFIEIVVDPEAAHDPEIAKRLADACPVDIFAQAGDGGLEIVERNIDECTLCELCLAAGKPGQIRVLKLYDERKPLARSA